MVGLQRLVTRLNSDGVLERVTLIQNTALIHSDSLRFVNSEWQAYPLSPRWSGPSYIAEEADHVLNCLFPDPPPPVSYSKTRNY